MPELKDTPEQTVKHTPGPWHVAGSRADERDFIVAESTGNTVCEPNIEAYGSPNDFDPNVRRIGLAEAKANARLIAAAPELLTALADLWEWASEARTHLTSDPVPDGLGAAVLAAIAKAEGRS